MRNEFNFKTACQEVNHLCDKSQYKEATFWERIKLTIHLLYCRACRKYTAKNQKLTETIENAEVDYLDSNDKSDLKESLAEAIKEYKK